MISLMQQNDGGYRSLSSFQVCRLKLKYVVRVLVSGRSLPLLSGRSLPLLSGRSLPLLSGRSLPLLQDGTGHNNENIPTMEVPTCVSWKPASVLSIAHEFSNSTLPAMLVLYIINCYFQAARVHKVIHQSFVKETKGSKWSLHEILDDTTWWSDMVHVNIVMVRGWPRIQSVAPFRYAISTKK